VECWLTFEPESPPRVDVRGDIRPVWRGRGVSDVVEEDVDGTIDGAGLCIRRLTFIEQKRKNRSNRTEHCKLGVVVVGIAVQKPTKTNRNMTCRADEQQN
jgi:hypothetical protein